LTLFAGGVVVNHALGDLFPSWSALIAPDRAAPPVVADTATTLDVWLQSRASEGARNGLVFDWKPAGAADWHLAGSPTIYVPSAYFTATSARFPVVVVVAPSKDGPAQGAWDTRKVNVLVPRSGDGVTPAVLVFLRVDHPDPILLTQTLPQRLDQDLRTSPRGWGVIGVAVDATVALQALNLQPLRFWSAAAVADQTGRLPQAAAAPHTYLDWQGALTIVGGTSSSKAPGRPGSASPKAPGHPGAAEEANLRAPVKTIPRADARLPAALDWICRRLPAPLAVPLTGPSGAAPVATRAPGAPALRGRWKRAAGAS
jgi:hypothetical protein